MANIRNTQLQEPQTSNVTDIDVNEVLLEYGLEEIPESSVVIQQGANTVYIPGATTVGHTEGLEPPPVDSTTSTSVTTAVDFEELSIGTDAVDTRLADRSTPVESEQETAAEELLNESAMDSDALDAVAANTVPPSGSRLPTEEALSYLIPTNPKSVEVNDATSRFSGAAWFEAIQKRSVILAGLGGIGSYVLYILSRMRPLQIFLYDDDVVERANLSGQMYSLSMIGKKKVNAMAALAKDFSEYNGVMAIPNKFESTTSAGDIMIAGFDNMEARSIFFNAWINHVIHQENKEQCLFIDGRLDMEEFQVFCIRGDDTYNIKRYQKEYLFGDWQAPDTVCSMKQTTYCANMIGSVIVNLYTNFISNTLNPEIERSLPFKTYYNASMMYFKTEE